MGSGPKRQDTDGIRMGKTDGTTNDQVDHYGYECLLWNRVSSKQSNFVFGSNRNKTQSVSVVFGLFRETKKHFFGLFQFVSVCFGVSDRYQNNRNKQNFVNTN